MVKNLSFPIELEGPLVEEAAPKVVASQRAKAAATNPVHIYLQLDRDPRARVCRFRRSFLREEPPHRRSLLGARVRGGKVHSLQRRETPGIGDLRARYQSQGRLGDGYFRPS